MGIANYWTRLKEILRPARTIPRTPWTSDNRWKLTPLRALILVFGLSLFGFGESLLFKANWGNSPWAVFAQGISKHSSLSIGEATFLISAIVLAIWFPLNERPGLGTVSNMVVIATALQIGIDHFPTFTSTPGKLFGILIGIALVGVGSGFYITCGLGPGPRDGLMTALHHKTGIRVGRVRMTLEIIVFLIGWALGGEVGLGTALFALLIGNSVAFGFKFVSIFSNR
jgi:uncharacterized membrane protein YczE